MLVQDAMHARVITISAHATLPEAVAMMDTFHIKRLPVTLDGQLVGLVTNGEVKRALPPLHQGLTPWEFARQAGSVQVHEVMSQPVLTVLSDEPLEQALRTMLDRRVGGLPVLTDQGEPIGMLTLTDVLRAEVKAARLQWGAVGQQMTHRAISTPAGAPASEAAAKLRITGLKVLPVLEGERLVGVLHERNLSEAVERAKVGHGDTVMGEQFFLTGKTARDLMRLPGAYVQESEPLHSAITKMLEADVHGLPVVDDDGLLSGVITISDVLKALLGGQVKVGRTSG